MRTSIALAVLASCFLGSPRLAAFGWPSEVAEVGRELSSADLAERERAAIRLSSLPSSSARSLVELALEDESDSVRLTAARAAVLFGYAGLGEQVVGWLKEPLPALRIAALRVLALELEGRHVPAIARAVLDPDELVRSGAVRCLGRAPLGLAQEVVSVLTAALDDTSPIVRIEAAIGLGRLGDASAVTPLIARLTDGEEGVRRAAAVALGAVGDKKAVTALSFAVGDNSKSVAAAAALGLGELADPSALPILTRTLLEPGWGPLHVAAAEALRTLDQREGWDAIVERLAEQDISAALRGLLVPLTPTARAAVGDCLLDSGGLALLECARVAAQAGIPLDGLVGRVRRGGLPTVKLFQAAGPSRDVELLVFAIERVARGSSSERHAALELLDRSAPLPTSTTGLLGDALDLPGLDAEDVARLLLLLGPTDAKPETLQLLTRASDPRVAASARALLATAAGSEVLGPFDATPLEAQVYGHLLSRGMQKPLAERLLFALARRDAPLPEAAQAALRGLPGGLPKGSVQALALITERERAGARDELLSLLVRQEGASASLARFFSRGSVADRRALTGFLLHIPGAVRPDAALGDADPWVVAQAAQRPRAADFDRLLALARSGSPAFVRSAALLGLSRANAGRAARALAPCDLLRAAELGVRAAALWLIDRAGVRCQGRLLEDIVLLEREPVLRELAARGLVRRDPNHRALRTCRAYDPDADVALACSGHRALPPVAADSLASVEVVPPWLDERVPSCPYALLTPTGEPFVGVTDRRGEALVPRASASRLLDPRVAL